MSDRKIGFWDRLAINVGLDTEQNVIRRETEMEEMMRRNAERWEADRAREKAEKSRQTGSYQRQAQSPPPPPPPRYSEKQTADVNDGRPMTVERAMALLGVAPGATASQIRAAYHEKVMQWHPDKLEGMAAELRRFATEQMQLLNRAYELLKH